MKMFFMSALTVLLAINLYAQEKDTARVEPKMKLELIWEKELTIKSNYRHPQISNFVFLDEDGYNLFSSMSKNPANELQHMKMLYIQGGEIQFLEGDTLKQTKAIDLGHPFQAVISKNGRNIAVTNRLRRDDPYAQEGEPAILRLFNSKGELLGEDAVGLPSDIYPLGNDKIVVLEYGEWSHVEVYRRNGTQFEKAQEYNRSYFLDYSEDGKYALISVDPYGEKERVVIDNNGEEALKYQYKKVPWGGFISPKGNYIAEVTRGKYIVLFDKNGKVIADHHVQGIGDYFGSFSANEQYLCVTPGRWRIYFLHTATGDLFSEYKDPDTTAGFQAISVSSQEPLLFFVGSTIVAPIINERGKFTTANRGLYIFNSDGLLIEKLKDVFSGTEFGSPLLSAALWCKDNYLLVGTPTKCYLYRILEGREK